MLHSLNSSLVTRALINTMVDRAVLAMIFIVFFMWLALLAILAMHGFYVTMIVTICIVFLATLVTAFLDVEAERRNAARRAQGNLDSIVADFGARMRYKSGAK